MKALLEKLPINWALVNNPANWIIILLMIAIGGAAIAFIFPASAPTKES